MRRNDDVITGLLLAVVMVALLGFGLWARVSGPCSLWSWFPAKDIPGRCIMGDK